MDNSPRARMLLQAMRDTLFLVNYLQGQGLDPFEAMRAFLEVADIVGIPDNMYELDDFCPQSMDLEVWRGLVEAVALTVTPE